MGERVNYQAYRKTQIEDGQLYQDFVVDCCYTLLGLVIVQYASKTYQLSVGESRTGVEIKHDKIYVKSGRLWIEVAEKAEPRPGPYAKSGIQRADNSWLYIIGNYDTIYIFSKRLLCALAASGRYPTRENGTKTSLGFWLYRAEAEKYAASILRPNASEKVSKHVLDLETLGRELHEALLPRDTTQIPLDLFRASGATP